MQGISEFYICFFRVHYFTKKVNECFYSSPINYRKSEGDKHNDCETHHTYSCPDDPGFHRMMLIIMRHIIGAFVDMQLNLQGSQMLYPNLH
jgi:hypothetical protein